MLCINMLDIYNQYALCNFTKESSQFKKSLTVMTPTYWIFPIINVMLKDLSCREIEKFAYGLMYQYIPVVYNAVSSEYFSFHWLLRINDLRVPDDFETFFVAVLFLMRLSIVWYSCHIKVKLMKDYCLLMSSFFN